MIQCIDFRVFKLYSITERRRLTESECPLLTRVNLGPHEDAAKLYVMDNRTTDIRHEVRYQITCGATNFMFFLLFCLTCLNRYFHIHFDRWRNSFDSPMPSYVPYLTCFTKKKNVKSNELDKSKITKV